MSGRKPKRLLLKKSDRAFMQQLLREGATPLRVAQRAQILLSQADNQKVEITGATVARDQSTVWRVCERYRSYGLTVALYDASRSGRPRVFSGRQRVQIETLACQPPAKAGWELTHWSSRSLAKAACEQQIVKTIHFTTVNQILCEADLKPHRIYWWKTTVWNEAAVARAIKVLWYYSQIKRLWNQGEVVIAVDEKPNIQVLERANTTQLMLPGRIERQEFEYIRHGVVNLLVGLSLFNGHMWAECLSKNDGAHFRPAILRLLHPYSWARRIHLIMDNGPSHTSRDTLEFFARLSPRVHVLFTPTNASWLNQAESLLQAFSSRYIQRGNWGHKDMMLAHLYASHLEYNHYFARPFDWHWTCQNFRFWLNNTPGLFF
jgi:hypothetical protein